MNTEKTTAILPGMNPPPEALLRLVNGQLFAVIRYTNNGAHPATITSYPLENLSSLQTEWQWVTINDV